MTNAAWFDRMARRQAVRRLGGGMAGGVLAALGIKQVTAAQGRGELGPQCQQCIAMFQGACVSTCVRAFEPSTCPDACFDGALIVCTMLGECPPLPE